MPDDQPARAIPVVEEEARAIAADSPPQGTALCLSGGGFRAMLFHLGALIRLNQAGMLRHLARVSSVSGGSITGALLGLRWTSLTWDTTDRATNLDELVVQPILGFSRRDVDVRSIIAGLVTPGCSISEYVARAYDRHLFHGATLQDLPGKGDGPLFVINSTNVSTGKLLRFTRPYMADYTIGLWRNPTTSLADAVAASSSFPPVLSPHRITPSGSFEAGVTQPIHGAKFRDELVLTDGGVYDNLGLQTAWSRCETLLVSDGGGGLAAKPSQPSDWARHGIRITEIADSQVRALRKRQLIDGFEDHVRSGTYWGIRSDIGDYGLTDPLAYVHDPAGYPANVPTRLTGLDRKVRHDLVLWGYIICDTAIRRWVNPALARPQPGDLPDDG